MLRRSRVLPGKGQGARRNDALLDALWRGLIYGIIAIFIGGISLGSVIGIIRRSIEKSKINKIYENEIAIYKSKLQTDENRVKNENIKKQRLSSEMNLIKQRINESTQNLNKMYSYNILESDYRNIYAVSSIYGYLKKGRTHSLAFNQATGDQGAYNIYENEKRLDKIITNTDVILEKLDTVIQNQYILAEGLRNAQTEINSLSSGVSDFISQTSNSLKNIENSQAMIAYNSERAANEASALKWMALLS